MKVRYTSAELYNVRRLRRLCKIRGHVLQNKPYRSPEFHCKYCGAQAHLTPTNKIEGEASEKLCKPHIPAHELRAFLFNNHHIDKYKELDEDRAFIVFTSASSSHRAAQSIYEKCRDFGVHVTPLSKHLGYFSFFIRYKPEHFIARKISPIASTPLPERKMITMQGQNTRDPIRQKFVDDLAVELHQYDIEFFQEYKQYSDERKKMLLATWKEKRWVEAERLATAIDERDRDYLLSVLHIKNKKYLKFFSKYTGYPSGHSNKTIRVWVIRYVEAVDSPLFTKATVKILYPLTAEYDKGNDTETFPAGSYLIATPNNYGSYTLTVPDKPYLQPLLNIEKWQFEIVNITQKWGDYETVYPTSGTLQVPTSISNEVK